MSSATLKQLIDKGACAKERRRVAQGFWLGHKIKSSTCKSHKLYTSHIQFEIPNIENTQYLKVWRNNVDVISAHITKEHIIGSEPLSK